MNEKAFEAAARALCRQAGDLEDMIIGGQPMWRRYLPAVWEAIEAASPKLVSTPVAGDRMAEEGGELGLA